MAWSIVQQIGGQAIKYVTFVVLAVLLAPSDFGLVGIAAVWIAFATVFAEVGFAAAIIQRPTLEPKHLSSTFVLNVGTGAFLTLAGILASWPLATVYHLPAVQPITAALSIEFFVDSLSQVQVALAQRELRFRDLALRDIAAAIVGGLVGITLAWRGYGVWSLVAQAIVNGLVAAVLMWRLGAWRPRLSEVTASGLTELWHFGSRIFLFNVFKYLVQNVDKLLVGYLLGVSALGLYTFAYRNVVFPVSILAGAVGMYLFPKYSRMQDDVPAVRSNYLLVVKATGVLAMPALIAVAALSPTLVPAVFGARWAPAVPLMQLFTLVALVQSVISPIGQMMKAFNRPGWLFWWSVFFTGLTVAALYVGAQGGILGIGLAVVASHLVALPIIYYIVAHLVSIDLKSMVRALVPALAATLVFGGLLWALLRLEFATTYLWAGLGSALAAVAYLLVLLWLDRTFVAGFLRRCREILAR